MLHVSHSLRIYATDFSRLYSYWAPKYPTFSLELFLYLHFFRENVDTPYIEN